MTTKDTREKIARALCNRHLGEGAFDDLLLDTETRIAYLEDADAILEALTATPAQPTQGPRGSIDRATENTVVQCDGFNAPDCTRAVISEFLHQAESVGLSLAAPTPAGEVDGLVAEIDALEKAYFDIPETEITENPQIYVLDPEIFQFLGKIADFLSAFDKALPKLRTALGGGWRDTESDSFESEPSICGYTPPQIEGET